MMNSTFKSIYYTVVSFLGVVILWQLLVSGLHPEREPSAVASECGESIRRVDIGRYIGKRCRRQYIPFYHRISVGSIGWYWSGTVAQLIQSVVQI